MLTPSTSSEFTMLKTGYQTFIIALLLLAFTSQTMAAATMTCQLDKAMQTVAVAMNMSSDDHMNMDHTDHSGMDHSQHANSLTDNHQKSDCCKTMGHCVFGGCSLAAASTNIDFLLTQRNFVAEDFYSDVTPTPLTSSLYRPPIIC